MNIARNQLGAGEGGKEDEGQAKKRQQKQRSDDSANDKSESGILRMGGDESRQ